MRHIAKAVLLSVLSIFTAARAEAREEEKTAAVWDRSLLVGGRIDLFPLPNTSGFIVVEVAPVRWASFEIGGGSGVVQRPAALAMLHLQWPLARYAPGIEAGFVTGPVVWSPNLFTIGVLYGSNEIGYDFNERSDSLVFGRLGGVFSMRLKGGPLHVRVHVGASWMLNRESVYCDRAYGSTGGCTLKGIPTALPYAGSTVGYAFNL